MQPTSDMQNLVEIDDHRIEKKIDGDAILTREQRKKLYRESIIARQLDLNLRLKDFFLGRREYVRRLDEIPRRKLSEDTDLMCRKFNGDMYGHYDDIGAYMDDRQEGDYAYAIPMLTGHVEQALIQIFKVRPNYTATANNKNDSALGLVATMCEELGTEELARVMNPVILDEVYNMCLKGDSVRIVGWEPDKSNPKKAKRTRYTDKEIETAGRKECADCKYILTADEAACSHCGSTNINTVVGAKSVQQVPEEYEVELGQNCVHIPHMLSIQTDLSAVRQEESTFMVEYGYIDKHVAEWEFQSPIEETKLGLPIEMQLRFDLERSSNQTDMVIGSARLAPPGREGAFGTTAGAAGAVIGKKQPLEVHFWEPSQYGQYYCVVDEPLPDGTIIPKGTLLGDFFPKGVRLKVCGDSIMEVDPYIRARKVTIVRYGRVAGTNSGAGLKRIMPLNDAENDNFNLNQTIKHTVGHPFTVINGQYVSELPGAGNILKVTRAGLDDVSKVAKQYPGQSMSQGDGSSAIIEQAMQFIAGTNTVGGSSIVGAPDMRAAGTATGIAAMQEQAAARQSGPVDDRIRADKEMIIQLLENIQEFSTDEQKQELSLRFGTDVVKAFFNTNLRHSITVGIKTNSDMPRSMALQQANFIAFGQAIATILPVAEQFPWVMELLSDMADSMGFPTSIGEGRSDRREAAFRLNVLNDIEADLLHSQPDLATNPIKFAAEMYAQLAQDCAPLIDDGSASDPSQMAPDELPSEREIPRIFLQVHESFMDVYKDALMSEPAKSWSEARKLCVIQMWLDHLKAMMSKKDVEAKFIAGLQAQLNPEPPPEATPDPAQEAEVQRQLDEESHQRELQVRAGEVETSRQEKDEDLQRELIKENLKHDLEQERAREDGERQLALAAETAKAKTKPTE